MNAVPPVETVAVSAYAIPTATPESDGTLEWNSTTLVLVRVRAGGSTGIGYSYADSATATLIRDKLAALVLGTDPFAIASTWALLVSAIRNLGRPGIASMAIAALDVALWDLKAKLLALPLVALLGQCRTKIHIYASGGFTSYTNAQLEHQFAQWRDAGMTMMKMKVGRDAQADVQRVALARATIGAQQQLFVDANGAYTRKQALRLAEIFADQNVGWFEEPVSSDDLQGLRLLRDRAPAGMDIAAGEYGYDAPYFLRMLHGGAVDVLQADATRCAGISGFLQAAALCAAFGLPLSSHCAPSLHLHACCAAPNVCHMEYFHDHVRIEHMLFDGAPLPAEGALAPDLSSPGLGLVFKEADAKRFAL